jgi:hypothetical protein
MIGFGTLLRRKNIDLNYNKKYSKTHHIIYSLCRSTHLESNVIEFFILRFFIYYDYSKLF